MFQAMKHCFTGFFNVSGEKIYIRPCWLKPGLRRENRGCQPKRSNTRSCRRRAIPAPAFSEVRRRCSRACLNASGDESVRSVTPRVLRMSRELLRRHRAARGSPSGGRRGRATRTPLFCPQSVNRPPVSRSGTHRSRSGDKQNAQTTELIGVRMVSRQRLELWTRGLKVRCSTN